MKTTLRFTAILPALLALVITGCGPGPGEPANLDSGTPVAAPAQLITVFNPAIAGKLAERLPLSPRLDTLEGKTIYMVDINWGGIEAAHSLFEEMQAWFSRNLPDTKIIVTRTQGNMFTDDPALWEKIAAQGDAAIVGVAS